MAASTKMPLVDSWDETHFKDNCVFKIVFIANALYAGGLHYKLN